MYTPATLLLRRVDRETPTIPRAESPRPCSARAARGGPVELNSPFARSPLCSQPARWICKPRRCRRRRCGGRGGDAHHYPAPRGGHDNPRTGAHTNLNCIAGGAAGCGCFRTVRFRGAGGGGGSSSLDSVSLSLSGGGGFFFLGALRAGCLRAGCLRAGFRASLSATSSSSASSFD